MDWIQVITIIASVVGVMVYFLQRVEKDIAKLQDSIDQQGTRIDQQGRRLDGHAMRIDQLYNMFVDLLKERK